MNAIDETKSLQEASKLISEHRLHRLAVVEKDKRQLYGIISTYLILSYLVANLEGDNSNFEVPISEFNVGSSKIISADAFESFLETLIKISKNGLSYLPIYNSEVSQCYFSLKLVILLIKSNSYFKVYLFSLMNRLVRQLKNLYQNIQSLFQYQRFLILLRAQKQRWSQWWILISYQKE